MLLSSKEEVEQFLSSRVMSLGQLASGVADSSISAEYEVINDIISDKSKYDTLLEEYNMQIDPELSFSCTAVKRHINESFCGGQKMVECQLSTNHEARRYQTFKLPLWKQTQEKTCFLPDIFKLARQSDCRLVVLLDGDRDWAAEGTNDARKYLTLNDTTIDSSIESECSDRDGYCVLTWLRVYGPGERIALDTKALSESGAGDGQVHDGKVFDAMSHEETAYGGYRCGVLRVDTAAWPANKAPSLKVWSAFEALYNRGFSEADAAYNCSNVLLVDVCNKNVGDDGAYWGVGGRAATVMALDVALHSMDSSGSNITTPPKRSNDRINSEQKSPPSPEKLTPTEDDKTKVDTEVRVVDDDATASQSSDMKSLMPTVPGRAAPGLEVVPVSRALASSENIPCELPPPPPSAQQEQQDERSLQELMVMAKEMLQTNLQKQGEATSSLEKLQASDECQDPKVVVTSEDDVRKAAELLMKSAENSDSIKQAYLSEKKKLSDQKLAERLKKRKQEKEQRAGGLGSSSSPPTQPVSSSSALSSGGADESQSNRQDGDFNRHVASTNVSQLCWELLTHSRCLALSSEQHQFVYNMLSRRATKLLATQRS
mmetsp:Transcript_15733/g.29610  ORF Transcript_15733/g.29610 Transcript_15733/m.29610 type:complete len:601 (+) Transcript_15733:49-1851(+)